MKALQNPVALATLLALQACSSSTTNVETPPAEPQATLDQPKSVVAQTFVMRGQVVLGNEVRSITPCGSQNQYWLDLPQDRFQQGLTLVRGPYEPLYGEVIGHLEAPSKDGFSSDYKARFVVDHINVLSAENPNRCDQAEKPTHAFGVEPSWSVKFAKNQLVFEQFGAEKQPLTIESSRIESDRRRYQFAGGSLDMKQQSCVDGMSDSLYGWSATFKLNDKTYHGCATLSNRDATQNWAATYQAQSTQNTPFSVTMTLNPDHSANTTYSYQNGEADTVERGYWQQLNPNQVQVANTQLQNQPLNSERIYTRDGYQLTAKKEKVGDVIYEIADGGITLFKTKQTLTESTSSPTTRTLEAGKVASSAEFNPKVDKTLREYFRLHKTDPTGTRYRWLTYDLNGDGNEELLAQLDWCGSGGCTLLIFENHQQKWRFNSRITLVRTPINLGTQAHDGWQDLILFVSGGGAVPNQHVLKHNSISYPQNPSVAPTANYDEISQVQLFSDGLTPHQGGVTL